MDATIKNEALEVTISSKGAELQRIVTAEGVELLWGGDPAVWPNHAPVCLPWCGPVEGDWFEYKGERYEAKQRHGFIREQGFSVDREGKDDVYFHLDWAGNEETWPWSFTYQVHYFLKGCELHTVTTANNRSKTAMPVQQGFHTALLCPFLPDTVLENYQVRFESGRVLALDEHLFNNDFIRYEEVTDWVQIEHKETGKFLRHNTKGFSAVLLWSKPGRTGFLCVEPWTGWANDSHDLAQRPGAILLSPCESKSWEQIITISI